MRFVLSLSVCGLFPAGAAAQEFRGTILGRVVDVTGGVVGGATVQAINMDTGVVIDTRSNERGNYQIPFLLPGTYLVTADHSGFKKVERPGIGRQIGNVGFDGGRLQQPDER